MKKPIISSILAIAMAVITFTGTGIKAVDKVIRPTVITASANTGFSYTYVRTDYKFKCYKRENGQWYDVYDIYYIYNEYYCGRLQREVKR